MPASASRVFGLCSVIPSRCLFQHEGKRLRMHFRNFPDRAKQDASKAEGRAPPGQMHLHLLLLALFEGRLALKIATGRVGRGEQRAGS